jgi:hypothetical protein
MLDMLSTRWVHAGYTLGTRSASSFALSLFLHFTHPIAVAVALPISFTSICHARAPSLVQGAPKDLAALSAKAAKAGADTVEDFAFSSEED